MTLNSRLLLLFVALSGLGIALSFEIPKGQLRSENPVIGVIDLPVEQAMVDAGLADSQDGYIPAAYAKLFELGGARIIVIPYNLAWKEKQKYLNNTNGLFMSGGKQQGIQFDELLAIYDYVKQSNKDGRFYPLMGVGMGFQEIVQMAARTDDIQSVFGETIDSLRQIKLLNSEQSFINQNIPQYLINYVQNQDGVTFNHQIHIEKIKFNENKNIQQNLIATSQSTINNTEFITSVEGQTLPIIGFQFHPERPQFEWKKVINKKALQHHDSLIQFGQYCANQMVQLASYDTRTTNALFQKQIIEYSNLTIYNLDGITYSGFIVFPHDDD